MDDFNIISQYPLALFWPLAVLAVGFVSHYLKPFIKTQDVLEKEIKLLLSKLREKVCANYSLLLEKAMSEASLDVGKPSSLRGGPPDKPDIIDSHAQTLFKSIEKSLDLKKYLRKIRAVYRCLFISTILGLIGLILTFIIYGSSIINDDSMALYKNIISCIMLIILIGQIAAVFFIRGIDGKIQFLEEEILDSI